MSRSSGGAETRRAAAKRRPKMGDTVVITGVRNDGEPEFRGLTGRLNGFRGLYAEVEVEGVGSRWIETDRLRFRAAAPKPPPAAFESREWPSAEQVLDHLLEVVQAQVPLSAAAFRAAVLPQRGEWVSLLRRNAAGLPWGGFLSDEQCDQWTGVLVDVTGARRVHPARELHARWRPNDLGLNRYREEVGPGRIVTRIGELGVGGGRVWLSGGDLEAPATSVRVVGASWRDLTASELQHLQRQRPERRASPAGDPRVELYEAHQIFLREHGREARLDFSLGRPVLLLHQDGELSAALGVAADDGPHRLAHARLTTEVDRRATERLVLLAQAAKVETLRHFPAADGFTPALARVAGGAYA